MESESDVETAKKKQSLCHGLEFIWIIASEFYLYFLGGKKSTLLQEKLKCSISCPPKIEIEALYKITNTLSKKLKNK